MAFQTCLPKHRRRSGSIEAACIGVGDEKKCPAGWVQRRPWSNVPLICCPDAADPAWFEQDNLLNDVSPAANQPFVGNAQCPPEA